jgi:membrane protease YdiL (CAAX protease family)
MTIGLALTALGEEFVSRSIAKSVIGKFTDRTAVILIVSAVIFALAHWSHGVPNVVANFFDGIVLMALYLHTRSIAPPIIAHYPINVWSFA